MQLTIDSEQPLDEVLRVVGAMFDVEISVGDLGSRATRPAGRPARRGSGRRSSVSRRRGRPAGRRGRQAASPADIRSWATRNGYDIATKGRVPATVMEAFAAAHR